MTTILVILACVVVVGILAVFWEIKKMASRQTPAADAEKEKLKEAMVRMEASVNALRESQQSSMTGLQQRMQHDVGQVNDRLTKAAVELAKVQEHTEAMKELQQILKSPKLRGNVGEDLMRDILAQCLPKANFKLQHSFRSGERVDAVILTKNGLIPIDSKFPLDKYLTAQKAADADKPALLKEFHKQVKKHIDSIAKKYILPAEDTVDFAFMYIPGEPVFFEIYNSTELVNYGADKKVILVSPNTFVYFLKIVMMGLEGEQIQEQAKQVMREIRALQHDSTKLGNELGILGKHVKNTGGQMEKVQNSYTRLGTKIENTGQLQEDQVEKAEQLADTPALQADPPMEKLFEKAAEEVAEKDQNKH